MRTTVEIDGPAVMARIRKVIDDGRGFYERLLEHNGVLRVRAHARFRDGALIVDDEDGETALRGVPAVLAVGARPWIAPVPGLESVRYLTSDDLLHLTDLPASLAIGGAGPIACEFAQALNRLGVEVTLVLRSDAPLRGEEPEARETILRVMREEGVTVVTDARQFAAREVPGGRELSWSGGSVTAEALLIATGREPRVDETDPAEGGIELDDGGARVDLNLRTTAPHVWALGDAIGGDHRRYQFTHVATHEGPQVAENALSGAHHEPAYTAMPRVTFTDPEVAAVGLTEAEARERGIDVARARQARAPARQGPCDRRARGLREGRDRPRERQARRRDRDGRTRRRHARGADRAAAHAPGRPRPRCSRRRSRTRPLSEAVKVAVRDAVAGARGARGGDDDLSAGLSLLAREQRAERASAGRRAAAQRERAARATS